MRKPAWGCVLASDCPSFGLGPTDPLLAAPLVKGRDRTPTRPGRAVGADARSARWTLVCAALAALLVVAFATQLVGRVNRPAVTTGRWWSAPDAQGTELALADVRRRADLAPCPRVPVAPGRRPCVMSPMQCAADGAPVDVARPGGRARRPQPVGLLVRPCAVELPAMAEYQRRAGAAVTVVTVHQDPNAGAGLQRLAELGCGCPPSRTVTAG